MKTVQKYPLELRDLYDNDPPGMEVYPEGYRLPWTVYVRQTVIDHPAEIEAGAFRAVWPGVGAVTFTGRRISFVFEEDYAAAKGYGRELRGDW